MIGGGVRVWHEDRGQAVGGDLEHRAAGARDDEVGGRERLGELLQVEVLAQVVARRQRARGQLGVVAAPADVQHVQRGASSRAPPSRPSVAVSPESTEAATPPNADGGEVDRARAERAAEHEHARLVRGDLKPRARAARSASGTGIGRPVTR